MLDLLEDWFFSEFGEANGGDARISADRMLDFIESLGMLPPFYKEFDRSLGEARQDIKNYKWEQEEPWDDNYDKMRSGCK